MVVVINEIFPNPKGKDSEGEFIEIYNNGKDKVNLLGWRIEDKSGKKFVLKNKEIQGDNFLSLKQEETKISLNNNGESVFLYSKEGKLIDKKEFFGVAEEGKSFARKGEKFFWTEKVTEGKANEFTEEILKDNFSTAQGEEKYLVRPVVIDAVLAGFVVSSRRRHTRLVSDWSSDVCSSDLEHTSFFQAEDGIRDWSVTGVQTCALPI